MHENLRPNGPSSMGMVAVVGIVMSHNGGISVDSEWGMGVHCWKRWAFASRKNLGNNR